LRGISAECLGCEYFNITVTFLLLLSYNEIMDKNKFAAVLPVIVGGLANKIIEEAHLIEADAFDKLYNSALYSILENEETKMWHYSVPKLFELWENEIKTGKLELPTH